MSRYKSAVVLCDMEWVDPDLRVANGIAISDQGDMLRLDAMLMTVQLNLRKMLEVRLARLRGHAEDFQALLSCRRLPSTASCSPCSMDARKEGSRKTHS